MAFSVNALTTDGNALLAQATSANPIVYIGAVGSTNDYTALQIAGMSDPSGAAWNIQNGVIVASSATNIQREDLNAIEIALTFKKLIDQYKLTQERLSERIGKKRATIANFLRLLKLPAEVQLGLRDKRVDMGHARALLTIDKPALQLKLYNEILKNDLSVRRVEELARTYQNGTATKETNPAQKKKSRYSAGDFDILKQHLIQRFETPVKFSINASGKGQITFPFNDDDDLERILAIFDSLKSSDD